MRDGVTVPIIKLMLVAGEGADYISVFGGVFTFSMNVLPLWADWYLGSASISFLLAGGSTCTFMPECGLANFFIGSLTDDWSWDFGSAIYR